MFIIRKKNNILKTGSFLRLRYVISRAWSHKDDSSSWLSYLPVASAVCVYAVCVYATRSHEGIDNWTRLQHHDYCCSTQDPRHQTAPAKEVVSSNILRSKFSPQFLICVYWKITTKVHFVFAALRLKPKDWCRGGKGNAIVSLFHSIPDVTQLKMLSTSSKYGIIRANLLFSDLTFSARKISTSSQAAQEHPRATGCVTICKGGDGRISRDRELCTTQTPGFHWNCRTTPGCLPSHLKICARKGFLPCLSRCCLVSYNNKKHSWATHNKSLASLGRQSLLMRCMVSRYLQMRKLRHRYWSPYVLKVRAKGTKKANGLGAVFSGRDKSRTQERPKAADQQAMLFLLPISSSVLPE